MLAAFGTVVLFCAAAGVVALIFHLWGPKNRFTDEKNVPFEVGSPGWCWEMGVKTVITPIHLGLGFFVVFMLGVAIYSPIVNEAVKVFDGNS
jgi:hypothetical protein